MKAAFAATTGLDEIRTDTSPKSNLAFAHSIWIESPKLSFRAFSCGYSFVCSVSQKTEYPRGHGGRFGKTKTN
jgi:hypothetical protein